MAQNEFVQKDVFFTVLYPAERMKEYMASGTCLPFRSASGSAPGFS